MIFWCAVPGSQGGSEAGPEARRGTLLTAQFLKPSGSEIGSAAHAADTNISELIEAVIPQNQNNKINIRRCYWCGLWGIFV